MKDAIQDYLGRPKQYNNIDGTGEMSMGLMMAMLSAAYPLFVYRFSREHPWKWLVATATALGLFTMALLVPSILMESWWLPMSFIGLAWLASGGTTLFLYIRHTQPPAPEAE